MTLKYYDRINGGVLFGHPNLVRDFCLFGMADTENYRQCAYEPWVLEEVKNSYGLVYIKLHTMEPWKTLKILFGVEDATYEEAQAAVRKDNRLLLNGQSADRYLPGQPPPARAFGGGMGPPNAKHDGIGAENRSVADAVRICKFCPNRAVAFSVRVW